MDDWLIPEMTGFKSLDRPVTILVVILSCSLGCASVGPQDDDLVSDDDDVVDGADDDDSQTDDDDSWNACEDSVPCFGNHAIQSEYDLEEISDCSSIEGELSFDSLDWLFRVDLPCLASVTDVRVTDCPILVELEFENLAHLGDLSVYNNPMLNQMEMPALIEATNVTITSNIALTYVELTSLTSIDGYLEFFDNRGISTLAFPCLETIEAAALIYWNPSLTSLDLSTLASIEDLHIGEHEALSSFLASDLTAVSGSLYLGYNDTLFDLGGLSALSAVGDDLTIERNDALPSLVDLTSLSTVVGGVTIAWNDCLSQIGAENLVSGIDVGGVVEISHNGYSYPCN